MASWKRPLPFMDRDRDGEDPGNRSKSQRRQGDSVPAQIGAPRDTDKLMEKILVPMIRRVVGEEFRAALWRHPCLRPRSSGQRQKTFQLRFKESPGVTYTGVNVEAKNGASLEVALYQCDVAGSGDRLVTEGPLSSMKIELCVLQGSFGSNGREDLSSENFRRNILYHTRKGGKLLTGDLFPRLKNGVCTVKNICVHDISIWAKSQQFRLGVKVAEPTPETEEIGEGISQPFKVKDCRGLGYKKCETPTLNDGIWRLPGIQKGGKIHELLQSKGINTVETFLQGLDTNSNQLKQELGKLGVGDKTWKKLTVQANKARPKQYLPNAPLDLEPQHLGQAVQGMPQHELLLPVAAQDVIGMPSTSTCYFGEAVHGAQPEEVGYEVVDVDYNYLAEFLIHEGQSSHQPSSCPNSGVYIKNRGSCTSIWSQIRSALTLTWTCLHISHSPPKRKTKLVPHNC